MTVGGTIPFSVVVAMLVFACHWSKNAVSGSIKRTIFPVVHKIAIKRLRQLRG